jgi:hypothetical protein
MLTKSSKSVFIYFKTSLLVTLSRLLPLIIAVGKYFATFFTAERIYKKNAGLQ